MGGGGGGGRRKVSSRGKGGEEEEGSEDSRSFSLWRLVVVKCFQKGGGAGKGALGRLGSILKRSSKSKNLSAKE